MSAELLRRFVSGSFASFDRIRPVEFERRWNLSTVYEPGAAAGHGGETIQEGRVQVDFLETSQVGAEWGEIVVGHGFRGVRRAGRVSIREARFPTLEYHLEAIDSRDSTAGRKGQWIRQSGGFRHPLYRGRLTPRFEVEHENRMQWVAANDSLAAPSFRFLELRPGLAWTHEALDVATSVEWRTEDDWTEGIVRPAAVSWTGQTTFAYHPSPVLDVEGSTGFRRRRFTEPFRVGQGRRDTGSLLLGLNTGYRPLRRAVELNVLYQGGTERSSTLQEMYVRTGPGIGQYVWEDGNEDGIIQIDELLPERLPNEGTYVKTFISSDSLVSVVNVRGRLRLEVNPSRMWPRPDRRWQRWLAHVATRSVFEVHEKTRDPATTSIYLLDLGRFRNPAYTMNGRLRVVQDVYVFRSHPRYGLNGSFMQLRSLSESTVGGEERFVSAWRLEGRLNPGSRWGLRVRTALEQDRLVSTAFDSRRYDISAFRFEPESSYALSDRVQVVASAEFGRKRDARGDAPRAPGENPGGIPLHPAPEDAGVPADGGCSGRSGRTGDGPCPVRTHGWAWGGSIGHVVSPRPVHHQ